MTPPPTADGVRPDDGLRRLIPLSIGALAFLAVVGPGVLQPGNIGWLGLGDPATHYLGWSIFRTGPWTFPVGLNPDYGLTIGNAIVYSDSIPLLAIGFKAVRGLLPEAFQYTGLWWLACFVLQAWFAWALVGTVTRDVALRTGATGLFVFSPPMLWRLQEHPTLVAHFLIVAALWLVYRTTQRGRIRCWATLLVVATLVHAYLLFMAAVLWIADLSSVALRRSIGRRQAAIEAGVVVAAIALAFWQAGYASVSDSYAGSGYGTYQMNLLAPFESRGTSLLFPDLVRGIRSSEGYNYLGLGAIVVLLAALPALLSGRFPVGRRLRTRWTLVVVLVGLTGMALSNHVTIGAAEVGFKIPDGIGLKRFLFTFRAAGRMFWPVFYVLLFCGIALVARAYGKPLARTILVGAMVLQVADTSTFWRQQHDQFARLSGNRIETPLQDAFWDLAATRYREVRHCPPGNRSDGWDVFAAYAARHHLATDFIYVARVSASRLERAIADCRSEIERGRYRGDSLYVIDADRIASVTATLDGESDLLSRIDGFLVLAPGWKRMRGMHVHGVEVVGCGVSACRSD